MKKLLFQLILAALSPVILFSQNPDTVRYPIKRLEYGLTGGSVYFYPLGDRKFGLGYSTGLESKYVYRSSIAPMFAGSIYYHIHSSTSHRKLTYHLHYAGISGMYYYGGFWFLQHFFKKLREILHLKPKDKHPLLVGVGIGPFFNYLVRGREGGKPITHANLNRFDPGIAIGINFSSIPSFYDRNVLLNIPAITLKISFRSVLDYRLYYLDQEFLNLSFKTKI